MSFPWYLQGGEGRRRAAKPLGSRQRLCPPTAPRRDSHKAGAFLPATSCCIPLPTDTSAALLPRGTAARVPILGQRQEGSLPPLCTSPTAHTPRPRRFTCQEPCSSTKAALSSLWEFAAERSAGTKGFHRHIPSRRPASLPPASPLPVTVAPDLGGAAANKHPAPDSGNGARAFPGQATLRLPLHPSGSRAGGGSSPPALPPRPEASRWDCRAAPCSTQGTAATSKGDSLEAVPTVTRLTGRWCWAEGQCGPPRLQPRQCPCPSPAPPTLCWTQFSHSAASLPQGKQTHQR